MFLFKKKSLAYLIIQDTVSLLFLRLNWILKCNFCSPEFSNILGTSCTSLKCLSVVWGGTLHMPEFYRTLQSAGHCIIPRLRCCPWPRGDGAAGCMLTRAESSYMYEVMDSERARCLLWPSLTQTLSRTLVTTAAALETSKWYPANLGESSHLL